MERLKPRDFHIFLTFIGLLMFLPFLGSVHLFDWDEINFAESAREMLVTGNFWQVLVDYEPFWEKPPLFLWLQALSMKLFGVNEFAARLPNAVTGIITLNVLYSLGRKFTSDKVAKWWPLVYLVSITPQFYFHSGIIDPVFNLFIFLSLVYIYHSLKAKRLINWVLAGCFLGLAVLTKGPVAGLVVTLVLVAFWIRNDFKFWFNLLDFVVFALCTLALTSLWFLPELLANGPGFISNFLAYQVDLMKNPVASHGQPWFYHAAVLLLGCFPASILALRRFRWSNGHTDFEFWMKAMFWVVLILFSIVTTKIVHYSSLCYFPLTYLAALRLQDWQENVPFSRGEKVGLGLVGGVWAVLFATLPFIGYYRNLLLNKYPNLIADAFTMENLKADVNWNGFDLFLGVVGAVVALWLVAALIQNKRLMGAKALSALSAYLVVFLAVIVPKVEGHTQGSIIEFYESIQEKNCYVDVYKFKSYAHYFYTKVEPLQEDDGLYLHRQNQLRNLGVSNRLGLNEDGRKRYTLAEMQWFLEGNIDKPVYLVALPRKAHELEEKPRFELVFNQGGFRVFKREPVTP